VRNYSTPKEKKIWYIVIIGAIIAGVIVIGTGSNDSNNKVEESTSYSSDLPESCKGVNSMKVDLYPTGEQCLEELDNGIYDWCLSQSDGDKVSADNCRILFYLKLNESCEVITLRSVDVCLMLSFKDLYSELIP